MNQASNSSLSVFLFSSTLAIISIFAFLEHSFFDSRREIVVCESGQS